MLPWLAGVTVGLALATIAISQIKLERAVTEQIRVELNAAGHGWAALEASGRSVALGGTAPSSSAADAAVQVAEGTRCRMWGFELGCARRVTRAFDDALAWPEFRANVANRVLTLSGEVPDEGTHWAIIDRARSAVSSGHIYRFVDKMTITGRPPPAGIDATAALVSRVSALCETGGATLLEGVVSMQCSVPDSLAGTLRMLVAQPLPAGYLGDLEIVVTGADSAEVD